MLGPCRNDRVVILDFFIVDDSTERKTFETNDIGSSLRILRLATDEIGRRPDLFDELSRQKARVRAAGT